MPLRWRLTLVFALGTALVIATAGLFFLRQMTAGLNSSLQTALHAQANAQVTRLATMGPLTPLPRSATQDLDRDLSGRGAGAGRLAQVLTPEGRLLATTDSVGSRPLADSERLRQAGKHPVEFTTHVGHERVRVIAQPAINAGRPVIALAGADTRLLDAATAHTRDALLFGGPPAVLLAGLGAYWLSGSALRPVERMRRRLAEITEQDTGARLETPSTHDEIATLAATMNDVLDRLAQALARERGFTADAGHELRTPLTTLKAELELAEQPGRSRQELVTAVAAAADDTDRLIRLAENLLLLSRTDEGAATLRTELFAPASLLSTAVRAAEARAAPRGVRIRLDADAGVTITADPDRLRQAVDNLLDNALRHAPTRSTIDVACTVGIRPEPAAGPHGELHGELPGTQTLVIEVRDHGPGFPPEFLPHAFERFSRADAARSRNVGGAGLGLAIVRATARAHGGIACADNPPDGGARVRLELPLRPPHHGDPSDESTARSTGPTRRAGTM